MFFCLADQSRLGEIFDVVYLYVLSKGPMIFVGYLMRII